MKPQKWLVIHPAGFGRLVVDVKMGEMARQDTGRWYIATGASSERIRRLAAYCKRVVMW